MDVIISIFGDGKELNSLQMSCRGIVIFFIALILIRISGRRSFGLHTPLDNIITIALGAILSRAVVGASPFVPIVATCTAITLLHRLLGRVIASGRTASQLIEGNKIILYEDGHFVKEGMKRVQVCEEDIMQGVRTSALTEQMDKIEKIYMERNGEISAIKKE